MEQEIEQLVMEYLDMENEVRTDYHFVDASSSPPVPPTTISNPMDNFSSEGRAEAIFCQLLFGSSEGEAFVIETAVILYDDLLANKLPEHQRRNPDQIPTLTSAESQTAVFNAVAWIRQDIHVNAFVDSSSGLYPSDDAEIIHRLVDQIVTHRLRFDTEKDRWTTRPSVNVISVLAGGSVDLAVSTPPPGRNLLPSSSSNEPAGLENIAEDEDDDHSDLLTVFNDHQKNPPEEGEKEAVGSGGTSSSSNLLDLTTINFHDLSNTNSPPADPHAILNYEVSDDTDGNYYLNRKMRVKILSDSTSSYSSASSSSSRSSSVDISSSNSRESGKRSNAADAEVVLLPAVVSDKPYIPTDHEGPKGHAIIRVESDPLTQTILVDGKVRVSQLAWDEAKEELRKPPGKNRNVFKMAAIVLLLDYFKDLSKFCVKKTPTRKHITEDIVATFLNCVRLLQREVTTTTGEIPPPQEDYDGSPIDLGKKWGETLWMDIRHTVFVDGRMYAIRKGKALLLRRGKPTKRLKKTPAKQKKNGKL